MRVPYFWDVQTVLDGRAKYPENLKTRVLSAWHKAHGVDGLILGLRASESKSRRIRYRERGAVYQTKDGWRCLPIARMSAEEAICVALIHDAPVNPVYGRQRGDLPFELIRDGTWWPHGYTDRASWMRCYYPEHYDDYIRAGRVFDAQKSVTEIL